MRFSIQSKILALSLTSTLIGTLTIGTFSTIFISRMTHRAALQQVKETTNDEVQKINSVFGEIEKYTQEIVMGIYTQINLDPQFLSQTNLPTHIENFQKQIISTSHTIPNAKCVYIQFNPKITYPEAGVFLVKDSVPDATFKPLPPTNISNYNSNDIEHVGWYYLPIQAGKPTWLSPYYNKISSVYTISYVIPIFNGTEEVGIVGVDIDFNQLIKKIARIRFLKTGYAYLEDSEGFIAYHPTIAAGLSFKLSEEFTKIEEPLFNGMTFVSITQKTEIDEGSNRLILQSVLFILLLLAFTTTITLFFAKSITKPLKKLTTEAKKVITGDMNADFNIQQNDEIGDLAKSFAAAKFHIQQHVKQMQGLVYRDQLTGVRNKMAYDNYLNELEDKIKTSEVLSYGIIVLDTNNLKEINDSYGHENGNEYLINSCKLICHIFAHSPIFRIGGDEFVIILTNNDLDEYKNLLVQLKNCIDLTKNAAFPWKQISIAYGIAIAEHARKTTISETFNKADQNMYRHKRALKIEEGRPLHREESVNNVEESKNA